MSDLLKSLKNIRSLRAAAKELSLDELESSLEKLKNCIRRKNVKN